MNRRIQGFLFFGQERIKPQGQELQITKNTGGHNNK